MGMMDWVNSDGDESPEAVTDGAGAIDGNDFGEFDDFGDLDDDFGDFDDDFGDLDDDFGGGSSADVADLQDRVGELETEVSGLSSTMNTVREENKQIGETVSDLDETVRKLLDIYEIVTRGINPFVDDGQEMGGLEQSGAFGIFDADEESDEKLDPEIANDDAETFFDDDFDELDAEDERAGEERSSAPEAALDGDEATDAEPGESDGGDGGSTFADLKEEYEAGEGRWQGMAAAGAPADAEGRGEGTDDTTGSEPNADAAGDLDPAVADAFGADGGAAGRSSSTATPEPTDDRTDPAGRGAAGARPAAETDAYLDALPETFVGESLAFEWIRYLVSVGGTLGAARSIRLYHRFGWISEHAREELDSYVLGVPASAEPDDPGTMSPRHHSESLSYIGRLAEDDAASRLLDELTAAGRSTDGIRS